ncbi:hypothetical protein LOK74_05785 [Brevibacillus humidisoli]|uniref:hypothetical protein n=1 Tax=Brevibacillus humidisoli TaxID=2895522 RepID=UPI001E38B754|nr:hypothetical protein [Brevibacillus humidisoli]UFJ42008.1 hypothetical protein LOK74_05785 [Brevibacillus humidisoli]
MNKRRLLGLDGEGRREENGGQQGSVSRMQPDGWRETLQECVIFGVLFKAVMVDLTVLQARALKLSYQAPLEELSHWAERRHYQLRRRLREQGCFLLNSERLDQVYRIQLIIGGYQQEAVYSVEWIRAECEERIRIWLMERGGERNGA